MSGKLINRKEVDKLKISQACKNILLEIISRPEVKCKLYCIQCGSADLGHKDISCLSCIEKNASMELFWKGAIIKNSSVAKNKDAHCN